MENNEDCILIYTDGACSGNPGPAGIGIVFIYKQHRRELSKYIGYATNNIAELESVRTALLEVTNKEIPIKIFTDSSYVCGVLADKYGYTKNKELIDEIKKIMTQFKKVEIIKVVGHSGVVENMLADKLATKTYKKIKLSQAKNLK